MARKAEWPVGNHIEEYGNPEEDIFPESVRDAVAELVDELPPEHRMVVEMRIWQHLPYRTIAKRLGYRSHKSVIDRFNEALEMIRSKIEGA